MIENHANGALCLENAKTPHELGTGNIYLETPSKLIGSAHQV
jgi:hypothetical protein